MKHRYLFLFRIALLLTAISIPDLLFAQQQVSGTVIEDGTNQGIPGVNVRSKMTNSGAVTDLDGNFRISVPANDTLVFSFVGYLSEEIPVRNQTNIEVSLAQNVRTLSELVVVGYGTQERARVTGAISSVGAKEISEQPVVSVDQALQGRAAGITVANSGSPGVSPVVRIRGMGTVGDNNPLYVIDGMPAGGLNEINPNDIESIEILKDASAAAIYGSRAANGVVMVTTKKGSRGKTQVNLDAYTGVQNAWRQLDLLNRDQYLAYGRDLLGPEGVPERFNNLGRFANVDTDWQDAMFRTAPIHDVNLSVNGGGDNSIFNVGAGYFKQDGIMLGTGFERYSFRANSEFTLGRLKVGETMTLAYTTRDNEPYSGGRTQMEHMLKMIPYIPVYDETRVGGFGGAETNALEGSDPENPVLNAHLHRNIDQNIKMLGTGYASFDIMDGLQYKLVLGLDMNFGYNDQFRPVYNAPGQYHYNDMARLNQTRRDYISPLISNQLSFNRDFGQHHIDALAVIEQQTFTSRSLNATGQTALTSAIDVMDIAENPTVGGTRDEYALISYLGRINYDFAGKYLFGASIRRDGGSRFGEEKWGTYPSLSAGWRISEEEFLRNVSAVSELKLRGSWGQVGNDKIPNYVYQLTLVPQRFYVLNGDLVPGMTLRDMHNPNVRWETTVMSNIGLDMGFMNNQITASVEYFNNETRDMLLPVPIPPSKGFDGAPVQNVGTVVNRGFELTANYNQNTGAFQWSLGGNISFVRNELLSLGTGNSMAGAGFINTGNPTTWTTEGEPIAFFYGWKTDGIFQTQAEVDAHADQSGAAPGDIRFVDINNDGIINDEDRTNIGHFLPDFSYGVNATANFRNFDLSLFIQGVSGNEILNTNRYHTEGMTRLFNASTVVLDRWTGPGTSNTVPRAIVGDPNNNSRISDRFVEDGSYMRLKNLTIGYTVPTEFLNNLGAGFIQRVRFYATSQNLLTFTNYTGYDPEIGARAGFGSGQNQTLNSGVDFGQYPQPRTFIGGIQIGF
jgi:TonB-linked SusC/RagA family outer membrane protein